MEEEAAIYQRVMKGRSPLRRAGGAAFCSSGEDGLG